MQGPSGSRWLQLESHAGAKAARAVAFLEFTAQTPAPPQLSPRRVF